MDVMGRLVFWALMVVIGAVMVAMAVPLALVPLLLVAAVAAVAWHEAKVPLGPPESRHKKVPSRQSVPGLYPPSGMKYGPYSAAPPPLEIEATRGESPGEVEGAVRGAGSAQSVPG